MPLGKIERATYVSVKDGKLTTKNESGEETTHDYLEGYLVDVNFRTKDFGGESVGQFLFEFKDDEGERYILSTGEKSGVSRALLNSLASIESRVGKLRVVPYAKDGYSKMLVYHNGERLDWKYKELPPVEERQVAGTAIKDDSKRLGFFKQIAEEISSKLNRVSQVNEINTVNI
jgi:hypothetical protein